MRKKQHIGAIPGMKEFIAEYVSDKALGEDGYLADKGLVTLPAMKPKRHVRLQKRSTSSRATN